MFSRPTPFRLFSGATLLVIFAAIALYARFSGAAHPTRASSAELSVWPASPAESGGEVAATPAWEIYLPAEGHLAAQSEVLDVQSNAPALSEQIELTQVLEERHVELTNEQVMRLSEITSRYQAARRHYEASIARSTWIADGKLAVFIPAYPDAGEALRSDLFAEIARAFGAKKGAEIEANLASFFTPRFAAFGGADQSLQVAVSGEGASIEFLVTSTSVIPPAVSGQAPAVTVRRETHMLPLEDPTGREWGPLTTLFLRERQT